VPCFSVAARRLDPLIEAALFARLGPVRVDELSAGIEEELRQHEMLVRVREDELRRAERHAAELEREYLKPEIAEIRPLKDRLRVLWGQSQARVAELHMKAVLEPTMRPDPLSELEIEELRQLLADVPRLWRHPRVTAQQRKTIVRLLVKEIVLASRDHELEITVHWVAGGCDRLTLLNARGVRAIAQQRDEEARGRLQTKRASREHAYRFIHERFLAGDPYAVITRRLVASDIPPLRRVWTDTSVESAVYRMQRGSVVGLPVLPRSPRLRAEVRRLEEESGPDARTILSRVTEAGFCTIHRRRPTLKTIYDLLRRRGPKASTPPRTAAQKPRAENGAKQHELWPAWVSPSSAAPPNRPGVDEGTAG